MERNLVFTFVGSVYVDKEAPKRLRFFWAPQPRMVQGLLIHDIF